MNTYETVFILRPELTTEEQEQQLEFFKGIITSNGGEISKVEPWGKLQFAYPLDDYTEGYYYLVVFATENAALINELQLRYKYSEEVLRSAVVRIDEKKFKLSPRREPVRRERRAPRDGARRPRGDEQTDSEQEVPAEEVEAEEAE